MNFDTIRKTLLLGAASLFVWWAWKAPAQDTATLNASARVPYGVSQVIQLEQAKIGDDTVIAYIRNSGENYNLSANDILYLRQQGVSDAVLTAMLTQPKAGVAMPGSYSQPVAPAPQYSAPTPVPDTSAYAAPAVPVQPSVTYVQTAPTTYDYSDCYPYSYSYPYYANYGYYGWPGWNWGWGWWGGGWHWGWGWHGGGNTGWHGGLGGGGWHGGIGGGWHGSWGGGGFHGGMGGGFHGGGGAWHGGGGGGFHGGGGGGFHGGGGGFHR